MRTATRAGTALYVTLSALSAIVVVVPFAAAQNYGQVCAGGYLWNIVENNPAPAYKMTFAVKLGAVNKALLGNREAEHFVILDAFDGANKLANPKSSDSWIVLQEMPQGSELKAPKFEAKKIHLIEPISNCVDSQAKYIAPLVSDDASGHSIRFLAVSSSIKADQSDQLRRSSGD